MAEYLLRLDSEITGCHTCPLCNSGDEYSDDWFCEALHGERLEAKNKTGIRRGDCPVNEVPTHGELKDANKILQWLNRICDEGQSISVGEIIDYIEKAPTIIEASEERE